MKKRIVVFAGNGCKKEKEKYYFNLAYRTGELLAEAGFATVTGGGPGLMDEVMKGAWEKGGDTIGIRLNVQGVRHSKYAKEFSIYDSLVERQNKLIELGDSFIALPGGIGTYYEIFAVIAMKRKKEIPQSKHMILLSSYFKDFDKIIDKFINDGFASGEMRSFYSLAQNPEEAIDILK